MAKIVGGIGTSHSPSMAGAYDDRAKLEKDPTWAPLFEGYARAREWLSAVDPDLIVIIYNDHFDRFFLDAYPTFAIGVADRFPVTDEGWGKRDFPDPRGDPDFAYHMATSLVHDEFDMTLCQDIRVDHGILSPLPYLCETHWPCPVLPIAVNVLVQPIPTPQRLWKLGEAIRRGVDSYKKDMKVVIFGTGGLSHHLQGTAFGFVNPDWDRHFMALLEENPQELLTYTQDDYMRLGGCEGAEVIMWLAMRAALPATVTRIHRNYHAPGLTGYGLLVLEPDENTAMSEAAE